MNVNILHLSKRTHRWMDQNHDIFFSEDDDDYGSINEVDAR
jgi:hypothetical protein